MGRRDGVMGASRKAESVAVGIVDGNEIVIATDERQMHRDEMQMRAGGTPVPRGIRGVLVGGVGGVGVGVEVCGGDGVGGDGEVGVGVGGVGKVGGEPEVLAEGCLLYLVVL